MKQKNKDDINTNINGIKGLYYFLKHKKTIQCGIKNAQRKRRSS